MSGEAPRVVNRARRTIAGMSEPVDAPSPSAAPERTEPRVVERSPRVSREDRRWSGLPIVTSLALVAFAVVFGIYGPRVVDRGSPSVGTPLWEVVDQVVEHFDAFSAHAGVRDSEVIAQESASAAMKDMLRMPFVCPDLTAIDFAPTEPEMLRLAGAARSAAVVYVRAAKDGMEYLCLAVAPYSEQYTVYSDFGRPQLLTAGGAITVDSAPSDRVHASALLWTDGAFLYVAVGSRRTTLLDVSPTLLPAMSAVAE